MAWGAKLGKFIEGAGGISVQVFFFKDGAEKPDFDRVFSLSGMTNANLEAFARVEIARLMERESSKALLTYKDGDTISLSIADPTPLSEQEQARSDFYAARSLYAKMLEDVRLECRNPDDVEVLNARDDMLNRKKAEYL